MRKARTIAALAGIALALTAIAASPAGGAARRSIAAFAFNAGAVNGIKASRTPKPGRLVPLGKNAKLPASVMPPKRGARGLTGPQGPAGPPGPAGLRPSRVSRARGPGCREDHLRRSCRTRRSRTILTFGGLILRAACSSAGRHVRRRAVDARQRPAARRRNRRHRRVLPRGRRSRCELRLRRPRLRTTTTSRARSSTGRRPGRRTVSVSFLAEEYSIAGVARCQFAGTAVVAQ